MQIRWPKGCTRDDLVNWGNFGFVCLDALSGSVIKIPHFENDDAILIERAIYERFDERGGNAGLLQYRGRCDAGIRLEFASNYDLRAHLRDHKDNVTLEQQLRWGQEIADTVAFIHSNGVIHGDLQCCNILLDQDLHAKVADFGGSSLDGSALLVTVAHSHRYPGELLSVQADIFALGSTLYEVASGQTPFDGQTDEEIKELFESHQFPNTEHLGLIGHIITNCWEGNYHSADEVAEKFKESRQITPKSFDPSKTAALAFTISAFGLLAAVLWVRRLARR
ncbi:kinase-like protein [Glonium stellatum]|uniref:Kinase-like protein n=1 Tax=Glonium stellatum TaxID=574774 RepID=A0A8E2F2R2_9PEZI|nr:kinase-like protein [Glonium stellatum]